MQRLKKVVAIFICGVCLLVIGGCAKEENLGVEPVWIIPPLFTDARPFSSQVAGIKDENGEWNFIDKQGALKWNKSYSELIVNYDYAQGFLNGVAVVSDNMSGYQYLYINGEPFPTEYKYEHSYPSNQPLSVAYTNESHFGYINAQRMWYIEPTFQACSEYYADGYSCAEDQINKQRFLIDGEGNISKVSYRKTIHDVSEGMLLVGNSIDGFYYESVNGEDCIGPFDNARAFHDGLAAVTQDDYVGFIDKQGQFVITPQFDVGGDFAEGFALVERDGNKMFIDITGKVIFEGNFESSGLFHSGCVDVRKSVLQGYGLIGSDGEWVLKPSVDYSNIDYAGEGTFVIHSGNLVGMFIPATGVLIRPQYDKITKLSDSVAEIIKNSYYGLISLETGEIILNPNFYWFSSYSEGVISAQRQCGGKFGYLDLTGKWIIDPQFDYAGLFKEGVAPVEVNGKYGYIANPIVYKEWIADDIERAKSLGIVDETSGNIVQTFDMISHTLGKYEIIGEDELNFTVSNSNNLSRKEMAEIIKNFVSSYGIETDCYLSNFLDVPRSSHYYDAISFAASQGFFFLPSDGNFAPDKIVNEDEMSLIALKIFEYMLDVNIYK